MAGGQVWVTSPGVDRGSTFFFTMYLDEEEHDQLVINEPEQQEDTFPLSSYISENAITINMISDWDESNGSVLLGRDVVKEIKDDKNDEESQVVQKEADITK